VVVDCCDSPGGEEGLRADGRGRGSWFAGVGRAADLKTEIRATGAFRLPRPIALSLGVGIGFVWYTGLADLAEWGFLGEGR